MKTIHITNVKIPENDNIHPSDADVLQKLISELYEHTLKDDPKFHFFYEPELIIRIDSEHSLEKVKSFLEQRDILFEEYDYPFPGTDDAFGEKEGGIVANNLDVFLPIFHAHSVAALTMDNNSHTQYLERVIHTAFNPKLHSREYEENVLMELARLKRKPSP